MKVKYKPSEYMSFLILHFVKENSSLQSSQPQDELDTFQTKKTFYTRTFNTGWVNLNRCNLCHEKEKEKKE